MRTYCSTVGLISALMLSVPGAALADDSAPAGAAAVKPAAPSVSEILDRSGIILTGYLDGTFAYQHNDTTRTDYSTFALQQAAFTLAKQPASGFGALVNVVAGQNPYSATGYGSIPPGQGATTTGFYLLQAFAQYVTGALTLQAGKFLSLAGVEVPAPVGNTNTTRSILFANEPITHTGFRATYAASDQLSLIVGVNDGWNHSQDTASASDKTFEAALSLTPSKALSWTLQGYYGRDNSNYPGPTSAIKANIGLLDTVLTWNASSALGLVGSVDYGMIQSTSLTPSAAWWAAAGYANYALNHLWRVSLRGEYLDDSDGYLTRDFDATYHGSSQKLKEVTLTFGYHPTSNFEFRVEGRYDDPDKVVGVQLLPRTYQGWFEAMYKF
jgi:Putative beta-barrel porin-2, OmpL-like. bbp2